MSLISTSASWLESVSSSLGLADRGSTGQKKMTPQPTGTRFSATPRRHIPARRFFLGHHRKWVSTGDAKVGKGSPMAKTRFPSTGSLMESSEDDRSAPERSTSTYRSYETLPYPGEEISTPSSPNAGAKHEGHLTSSLSASASRLDCSVHYSGGTPSPFGAEGERQLFSYARETLVQRICAPPLPGSEHPLRTRRGFGVRPARRGVKIASGEPKKEAPPPRNKCSSFSRSKSEGELREGAGEKPDAVRRSNSAEGLLNPRGSASKDQSSFLELWLRWKFNNELNDNGEPADLAPSDPSDVHAKVLRRTRSDMSKSRPLQRHLLAGDPHYRQSLGRQYSSPQPIKVRPFHRLPDYSIESSGVRNPRIKRSKGSTHLRRSVSQPLDLDKSFQAQVSLMKMRIPDEEASVKNQRRRPSVGNLLSEEDNTSEEDAGLSDSEDFRQGFKRGLEEDEEIIVFAEALWDHVSLDSDELVFKAGDLVTVLDSSDKDWWWGRISHRSGWFPASFVRLLVNQEDHQDKDEAQCELEDGEWSSRKLSLSSLSHDQVRANVINEILSTEKDYVKHLKDVVEGYLRQVRKRPDMFSEETINTIFGNMEALFIFHAHFLEQLEHCIDYENPHRSCIGECFIRNKSRFEIYSEYCNNHPSAVSELQVLYQDQKYVHFFEACRLLQEMIDISIDGFLLTPVQKICKYPLQLQELLKYTRPNHPDYSTVHGAMQAMKEVALLVNERRRRMECLEKIALWQKGVEGWEGPDLLDDSSQLIHQGEVTKGVGGSWPKEVALFLFDHQMVYCKRDLLKRNTYVYRGRINTDLCEVIDIPDDPMRSAAFHHAWKIHYLHKSKTYVFTCKTASEKAKWLLAFKRERTLVAMDEASGFVASEKQKQVARMAARNQRTRPKKPRVKTHARKQVMTYAQAQLLVNTEKADENRSNSLPSRSPLIGGEGQKKKGHWFSFGGHKKSRNNSRNQKHNSFHNS